jgi:hypothetical protein
MASDAMAKYKETDEDNGWNIVAILKVTEERDSDRWAIEQVVTVGQALEWPAANLAQLRLTLSQAIQNARRLDSASAMIVRLFVRRRNGAPGKQSPVRIRDPSIAPRGWSFFLVQKSAEAADLSTGAFRDVIELYLYQE